MPKKFGLFVPVVMSMQLGLFWLSCATIQRHPDVNRHETQRYQAPKQGRKLSLPPSESWEPLQGGPQEAISLEGIRLFSWNWKVMRFGDSLWVGGMDFRRHKQHQSLPFDFDIDLAKESRSVLNLGVNTPLGIGAEWIIGYKGFHGGNPGSLWWANGDGRLYGPIAGGSVNALYLTRQGVVGLFGERFVKCNGKKKCGFSYECTVLLVRVLGAGHCPGVEHVVRFPGTIMRHILQDDDSILLETQNALWLVMPSGREVRHICSTKQLNGSVRSALLTEDGDALVLTTTGLWRAKSDTRHPEKICSVDTSYTYAMQPFVPIFPADNGDIYLGLTYFLVKLTPDGEKYHAEWFVPADCLEASVGSDGRCFCIRGKLATRSCSKIGSIMANGAGP